jgi:hypothetical protein
VPLVPALTITCFSSELRPYRLHPLITTDNSVRPINVTGASTRPAELVAQALAQGTSPFVASVRFGNLLGSSGSVVPMFRKQIAEGGPITSPTWRSFAIS